MSSNLPLVSTMREDVKKYYADLLILQYRNKPKARETIKTGADIYLGDGIVFQLENILDVDTAVGPQLDLIGKIVGCNRVVEGFTAQEFFSFERANALGFSTKNILSDGIFKTFFYSMLSKYALPDEDYRSVIKFKILANSQIAGWGQMVETIFNIFGGDVKLTNNKDLSITYTIISSLRVAVRVALRRGYLRAPLGIAVNYVYQE